MNHKQTMTKEMNKIGDDVSTLADDARNLMAATADVAGDEVAEARKRLGAALKSGEAMMDGVREKAFKGAKIANKAVHEHPYGAIGIAAGVGVLLGALLTISVSRHHAS
jgi:ElaB/YqjD/DUF883 family membrane-anchored ribosome-binding protein